MYKGRPKGSKNRVHKQSWGEFIGEVTSEVKRNLRKVSTTTLMDAASEKPKPKTRTGRRVVR